MLSILGYHQGGPRQVDVGMWNWKAIDVVNAHVRRRADLMESMRIGLELTAKGLIAHLDERREFGERHPPAGLVVGGRQAGGSRSCMAMTSVPPSASASVIVIVISPCSAGSVVSNSTTSTTCSFGTSFTKRPW